MEDRNDNDVTATPGGGIGAQPAADDKQRPVDIRYNDDGKPVLNGEWPSKTFLASDAMRLDFITFDNGTYTFTVEGQQADYRADPQQNTGSVTQGPGVPLVFVASRQHFRNNGPLRDDQVSQNAESRTLFAGQSEANAIGTGMDPATLGQSFQQPRRDVVEAVQSHREGGGSGGENRTTAPTELTSYNPAGMDPSLRNAELDQAEQRRTGEREGEGDEPGETAAGGDAKAAEEAEQARKEAEGDDGEQDAPSMAQGDPEDASSSRGAGSAGTGNTETVGNADGGSDAGVGADGSGDDTGITNGNNDAPGDDPADDRGADGDTEYHSEHRGAGSYSIMSGDREIVEGLNKAASKKFNAMTIEEKRQYVAALESTKSEGEAA